MNKQDQLEELIEGIKEEYLKGYTDTVSFQHRDGLQVEYEEGIYTYLTDPDELCNMSLRSLFDPFINDESDRYNVAEVAKELEDIAKTLRKKEAKLKIEWKKKHGY